MNSDTYNLSDIGTQLIDQNTAGITINGNDVTIVTATNKIYLMSVKLINLSSTI